MTGEKVLEVIAFYRSEFEARRVGPEKHPYDSLPADDAAALRHCHQMLDRMEEFVREGHMDKAFRWLGFLQGVLWRCGVFTLDELRHHNMS